MNMRNPWMILILTASLFISGCSYKKGESYYYTDSGDTVKFIVRNSGSGNAILKKVGKHRAIHAQRRDDYRFVFLSDSTDIIDNKSVLLSHSEMPDYEEDLLTRGYLGAFGTKEVVTYMIVTVSDFEKYFIQEREISGTE
ncbi:MAG: hypothetical protein JXB19_10670 [Bacteroidales bacterium]|nr:hypothetical protein [Bacteroidales bacterium]